MNDLDSARMPDGFKVSIALKELRFEYTVHRLDLGADQQKQRRFRKANRNGWFPASRDRDTREALKKS